MVDLEVCSDRYDVIKIEACHRLLSCKLRSVTPEWLQPI